MKFSVSAAIAFIVALNAGCVTAAPVSDNVTGLEKRDSPMFTTVSTWPEWELLRTRFRFANIECNTIHNRINQMQNPESNFQCWDGTQDPNLGSWVFDVSTYNTEVGKWMLACAMSDLVGGGQFCTPQSCCGGWFGV